LAAQSRRTSAVEDRRYRSALAARNVSDPEAGNRSAPLPRPVVAGGLAALAGGERMTAAAGHLAVELEP
jgi:hypothetical protein